MLLYPKDSPENRIKTLNIQLADSITSCSAVTL